MLSIPSINPHIPKNLQHIDPVPVDTTAPLSWFARTGYYVVGNKIFRHKVYAMQEATRQRMNPTDVTWVFNNDVYDSLDWKTVKSVPLTDMYRLRAQQLREKYDYLILSFSGGGDSTNVLDSFVMNKIRLDEVVVYWPHKHTSGKYTVSMDTSASNFLSEWDFNIEPKLKWLEKVSPSTKITILDWTEKLHVHEPDEDIVELSPHHNYLGYKRYQAVDTLLLERQTQHKNYAFVTGINPAFPWQLGRHLFTMFSEGPTCSYGSDYTSRGLCRNVEFFYWTPDMPEIVSAQCHALLAALKADPKVLSIIPKWGLTGPVPGAQNTEPRTLEQLRQWTKQVLYPTYDYQNLQVDKNSSPLIAPEWYSWFYDNKDSVEIVQPHSSGITSHQNLIDPSFFIFKNNQVNAYHMYRSKLYYVGDLS